MKNKEFYLNSYEFISGLINQIDKISDVLSHVCTSDYREKFNSVRETISLLNDAIKSFTDKWKNNDEEICKSLETIKEYYTFYQTTLNNSSPSMFARDSKYIIESLYTSKLALINKLKKIKDKL